MPWHITGTLYNPCSCKVGCPCALGEMEADQGWCSAVLLFDVRSGNVDGTDVSGAKVAMVADWPSGFLGGRGTGRVYFDSALSPQQRAALELVLTGQHGGTPEIIGALVPKVLPSKQAPIKLQTGPEETRITVGDFGQAVVKPLRAPSGEITRLLNGAATFREDIILAKGIGTYWRDPDLRRWESAGHGEQSEFDWSG